MVAVRFCVMMSREKLNAELREEAGGGKEKLKVGLIYTLYRYIYIVVSTYEILLLSC